MILQAVSYERKNIIQILETNFWVAKIFKNIFFKETIFKDFILKSGNSRLVENTFSEKSHNL